MIAQILFRIDRTLSDANFTGVEAEAGWISVCPQTSFLSVMGKVRTMSFLAVVDDRCADTWVPIIQEWIPPRTTISGDEWAAYTALGQQGYDHLINNLPLHIVDPITGAHTQRIGSLRASATAKLKTMRWMFWEMLRTYLVEFLWGRKHGRRCLAFDNVVRHISQFKLFICLCCSLGSFCLSIRHIYTTCTI